MNKITIIGNLTRAPESRTTQSGKNVCNFTVAVNRRGSQQETDYFRVQAWDKLGENCQKFLDKGRKVCVMGPVSVETYTANNGESRANMSVLAQDVEFLSSRNETDQADVKPKETEPEMPAGFEEVEDDDLPF